MSRALIGVYRSSYPSGVSPTGWTTHTLSDVTFLTYLTDDGRYEIEAWTGPVSIVGTPDRFEADTGSATLTSSGSRPAPPDHGLDLPGLTWVAS